MSEMTAEEKRLTVEVAELVAKYDRAITAMATVMVAVQRACETMVMMEMAAGVGDHLAGPDLAQEHREAIWHLIDLMTGLGGPA